MNSTKESPLLTIGIPTFSNAAGVEIQLRNITNQIEVYDLEGKVEVIISDNSENTETEKCVLPFTKKSYVRYFKNSHNLGYDRNVDGVLSKALGAFCWTLSDNDPISSESLISITNTLSSDNTVGHIIIDQTQDINNPKNYTDYEQVVTCNKNLLGGLVSQNIFNTKHLPVDRNKYYGNLWFHLSILFEVGARNRVLLIPSVFAQNENTKCGWAINGAPFFAYTNLLHLLSNLENIGYSKEFSQSQYTLARKNFPHQLASGKLYGLKIQKKHFETIWHFHKNEHLQFILCIIILLMPTFILRFLKLLKPTIS